MDFPEAAEKIIAANSQVSSCKRIDFFSSLFFLLKRGASLS
jgi:hypothetical protein